MRVLSLVVVGVVVLPALAAPVWGAELALKRVMLSSAGVGYFEYEAEVDGPAELGLDVKLDQVDDVLKSLVVFDDAGGVGGIELPGRDQSHSAFGDVPFGPEGLASPLAFLNSLQGVEVTIEGARPMRGRILHAETVREPRGAPGTGEAATRTRVSVLTDEGLKQFVLEESDSVQVADAGLRARIGRALAASRHESAQDARHLTIRSAGTGHRTVRVSYVAVAPLWKASYRLMLPAADADPATAKARLQGWATLENETGSDWSGVAVTVQYGNPVTFHQAIYRSYFVARPEVPVEVLGRLLPDVDQRARDNKAAPAFMIPPPPAPAAMAPGSNLAAASSRSGLARLLVATGPSEPSMEMGRGAQAVQVAEGAEETVFTIPAPIDLAAGHSASVPILDAEIPAVRVALAREPQAHPLAAIRLKNDTQASLPAGILTLYDAQGSAPYAGDARIGGLPAGESRLVAYAQDLRTGVEYRHEDAVTIASLKAADGVLTVDRRNRRVAHVVLTAPAREPRHVLLEAAKEDGAKIAAGFVQPSEETAAAWRFAVDLKPGEVKEVVFAVDRSEQQSITVLDDEEAVAAVLNVQGVSDAARAALTRVAGLRGQEAARMAEREQLGTQMEALDKDEARIRANLGAVQTLDALRTRLVRQLDADETKHGQLETAIAVADDAVAKAHRALVDGVGGLRF